MVTAKAPQQMQILNSIDFLPDKLFQIFAAKQNVYRFVSGVICSCITDNSPLGIGCFAHSLYN